MKRGDKKGFSQAAWSEAETITEVMSEIAIIPGLDGWLAVW